jgi:hypothetical protein
MGFEEGGDADVANLQTYQMVPAEVKCPQIRKLAKFHWNGT